MSQDDLTERIRRALAGLRGLTEKKMFGGSCFMVDGHMIGGVLKSGELVVRVGPDVYSSALTEPHAREMVFTGRAMKGFIVVDAEGYPNEPSLMNWLARGVEYASSLPPKKPKKPKRK